MKYFLFVESFLLRNVEDNEQYFNNIDVILQWFCFEESKRIFLDFSDEFLEFLCCSVCDFYRGIYFLKHGFLKLAFWLFE